MLMLPKGSHFIVSSLSNFCWDHSGPWNPALKWTSHPLQPFVISQKICIFLMISNLFLISLSLFPSPLWDFGNKNIFLIAGEEEILAQLPIPAHLLQEAVNRPGEDIQVPEDPWVFDDFFFSECQNDNIYWTWKKNYPLTHFQTWTN